MSPVRAHRAALADVTLAYDEAGDTGSADAVVFLHGFPHGRAFWAPQLADAPALAPGWRLVAPDLRGFGDSDARPPYSVDRYADDVAALLDRLGLPRAVVVGLSMGGYVAFALWRRHAARVRALVLADTRAAADTPAVRARRHETIALARERGAAAVADAQLEGALGATSRATRPDVVARLRALMAAAPVPGIVGALEAMLARPDSTPTLAELNVPALVVVGAEDAITRPSEARAMAAAIRGARFAEVDGAGHVSSFERPDAFNTMLGDFLAEVRRA